MISYISSRGADAQSSFADILISGTASDGGLYIPTSLPRLTPEILQDLAGASYATVAKTVLSPFVEGTIEDKDFDQILHETYELSFDHAAVAPLVQIGPTAWIMELFHGPTLSFKDYALQLLGRMFDHVLEQRGEKVTIIGATSGDTGSAAIEACRGCKNIEIYILHPHERTSLVQRKQMTTITDENVHNIAIEGTFDDCQTLVKDLFADKELNQERNLAAVNSINWARIMAQTVYYVAAAVSLGAPNRSVSFTVPTGNFGNIYAAWTARKMGLPIHRLVVASNRNDILTRFFETGEMSVDTVNPSLSPSMDIQISSNFERFLCDMVDRDYKKMNDYMEQFKSSGSFKVDEKIMNNIHDEMRAFRCDDDTTLGFMAECFAATGEYVDPHTAVGLCAATQAIIDEPHIPMVALACAHPSKFPDAVAKALGHEAPVPDRLKAVLDQDEKFDVLACDIDAVRQSILS